MTVSKKGKNETVWGKMGQKEIDEKDLTQPL
jgi:hypothetical protein